MVGQQTIKWTKLSEDTTAINVYYPYFVAKHHHDHGHTVAGKQTNMSFYEHNGWPGTGPGKHGHLTIVIMIINFSIKLTSDHTKSNMTLGPDLQTTYASFATLLQTDVYEMYKHIVSWHLTSDW